MEQFIFYLALIVLWRLRERTPAAEAQAQFQPLSRRTVLPRKTFPSTVQTSPSGNGCREDSTAIYLRGYAPKRASWKH